MDGGAGPGMAADRCGQSRQQEDGGADPVGEGRPLELDAGPGVDHALPVQGKVVAIFRDQHMREQAGAGPAPLDRQRGHRRLGDRLAGAAAHAWPDVADDLEVGGHILEHLPLVLAQLAEDRAAAAWAGTGRRMHDGLARQMLWQRCAARGAAGPGRCRRALWPGRGASRLALDRALLEVADQEFELLDGLLELLRRAAEPRPTQDGQLCLELLDMQRLGVDLGVADSDRQIPIRQLGLQRHCEGPQGVGIGRQTRTGQRHAFCLADLPALSHRLRKTSS